MSEHEQPPAAGDQPTWSAPSYEVLSNDATVPSATTVVPDGDAPPAPSRRRRWVAIGAAAAVVVAAGTGAVAVSAALGGGGAQPETVVPANAVLYAELDLDPSASQKVDAFRFLRKFPGLKDAFTSDGGYGPDFAKLFQGGRVDYATDIEPWLGKRFAVAVVPGASSSAAPRFMVAVQTTDEAKAKASLQKLAATQAGTGVSVAVSGGYAVVAAAVDPMAMGAGSGDVAGQLVSEAASGSLADSSSYQAAIEPYGDSVATLWTDNKGLGDALKPLQAGLGVSGTGLDSAAWASGSSVAVLHFDGDTLELAGRTTGSTFDFAGGVPAVSTLPDDTLVAVGGNDVGTLLRDAYGPVWEQLSSLATAGSGADLSELGRPSTWPTLLGDQTVLGVGATDGVPAVGVHVVGGADTVAAILRLVQKTQTAVAAVPVPDGIVLGTDARWNAELAAGGDLGGSAGFRDAVPDAAGAGLVAYVDVAGLLERLGSDLSADDKANLEPLTAVGLTVTSHDGASEFRVRVLTD